VDAPLSFDERVSWGLTKAGTKLSKGKALFPRLDLPGETKSV
jgi:hypothetical protein